MTVILKVFNHTQGVDKTKNLKGYTTRVQETAGRILVVSEDEYMYLQMDSTLEEASAKIENIIRNPEYYLIK